MRKIIFIDEVDYEKVEWGLTKNLVGSHNVGAKRVKVNLTEYLPGYMHKLHSHPNQDEVIYANWPRFRSFYSCRGKACYFESEQI